MDKTEVENLSKNIEKLIKSGKSPIVNQPLTKDVWKIIKGSSKNHPYLVKSIFINDNAIYIYTSGLYRHKQLKYMKYRKYTTFKIVIENNYISDIYIQTNHIIKKYKKYFSNIEFLIPTKFEKKKIAEVKQVDAINLLEYLLTKYYNINSRLDNTNKQIKYYSLINPIFRKFAEDNPNLHKHALKCSIFNIAEELMPIYVKTNTNIEDYTSLLELIVKNTLVESECTNLNTHYNIKLSKYIKSRSSKIDNIDQIKTIFYGYYIYLTLILNRLIPSKTKLSIFLDKLLQASVENKLAKIKSNRYITVLDKKNPFENSLFTFTIRNKYYHVIHNDFTNSIYDSKLNLLYRTSNLIFHYSQKKDLFVEILEDKLLIHDMKNRKVYECIKHAHNLKEVLSGIHRRAYNNYYICDVKSGDIVECNNSYQYITKKFLEGKTDFYVVFSDVNFTYIIYRFPKEPILQLPDNKSIIASPNGIFTGESKYYFIIEADDTKEYEILNTLGITLGKFNNLEDAFNQLNKLIKQEKTIHKGG